jgi:hypothetical protein
LGRLVDKEWKKKCNDNYTESFFDTNRYFDVFGWYWLAVLPDKSEGYRTLRAGLS